MKRRSRIVASLIAATALMSVTLSGCTDDFEYSDEESSNTQQSTGASEVGSVDGGDDTTWTVMVYMCGSDLESEGGMATDNLMEMMEVPQSENINVVVETGGANQWMVEGIDSDVLGRYHLEDGDFLCDDTIDNKSMGKPKTLSSFVSWGAKNYPADKYMLLFWDHGGGSIGGVCQDEQFENDCLELPEIYEALADSGVGFEVVGFDACLMASLETAATIKDFASYMVASEETEPGEGWDYDSWLGYLCENPGCDGANLGAQIVDSYMSKCAESLNDSLATLSVVDLSKIDDVTSSFEALSGEMVLSADDSYSLQAVVQGAKQTENYGGNTDEEGYSDMVDLGDLVYNTSDVLSENSQAVIDSLNEAVVYESHGDNRDRASGLSVFYPIYLDDEILQMYSTVTDNNSYLQFISILNGDWDSEYWSEDEVVASDPVTPDDVNVEFEEYLDDDQRLHLSVTSGIENVESVRFDLLYQDEDTGALLYLGCDNNITGDYESGEFQDNFEGTWITIGGEYVNAEIIEETDDYNLYSIPIKLNGEEMYLRAVYDYDSESFAVLGTYDGMDGETGTSGRDIRQLQEGDQIEFLFTIVDLESGENETFTMGEITWTDDTVMKDDDLGDGSFVYMWEITDVFGNVQYGEPVTMTVDGEYISVE